MGESRGRWSLCTAADLQHRYTYSLVFASDMYRTIFKRDPLDPELGKLYRDKILLPGGSRDEMLSLEVISYQY